MERLRFGTYLAPNILPLYKTVAEGVGRRLGIRTELQVETSYETCVEDVNDVCFVCSLAYIMFERAGIVPAEPVAAPVLTGKRYRGEPIYYSDVVVRHDSPARRFLDLRGSSWAYNEPMSHSGYGITRCHLVEIGETDGFFGRVVESGFHEESLRMVLDREVDASAIDSQVLSVVMRDDPSMRSSLRVIESLGPSTIQPIAVSRRLSSRLRRRIRNAVIDLGRDGGERAGMQAGMVERFVGVHPSSYDDIRRMVRDCEKAGFMELR